VKYFVGLVPSDEFTRCVQAFCRRWPRNRHPDHVQPHITLKAPPGIGSDLDAWLPRLRAACLQMVPVPIAIGETSWFRRDVLYLRVDRHAVWPLHQCVLDVFGAGAATATEGVAYTPHLTLGLRSFGMSTEELEAMCAQVPETFARVPAASRCEGTAVTYEIFTPQFVRVFGQAQGAKSWTPVADLGLAVSDNH